MKGIISVEIVYEMYVCMYFCSGSGIHRNVNRNTHTHGNFETRQTRMSKRKIKNDSNWVWREKQPDILSGQTCYVEVINNGHLCGLRVSVPWHLRIISDGAAALWRKLVPKLWTCNVNLYFFYPLFLYCINFVGLSFVCITCYLLRYIAQDKVLACLFYSYILHFFLHSYYIALV